MAPPQAVVLDGDFDGDVRVDGNDFLVWQSGNVNQGDLNAWKQHFASDNSLAAEESILAAASGSSVTSAVISAPTVEDAIVGETVAYANSTVGVSADNGRIAWLAGVDASSERSSLSARIMPRERNGEELQQASCPHANSLSELDGALRGTGAPSPPRDQVAPRLADHWRRLAFKDDAFASGVDDSHSWRRLIDELQMGDDGS
jgi:hypothetical protein